LHKDEKTFKKLRWGEELNTDIVCDRIQRANSPSEGSEISSRKSKSKSTAKPKSAASKKSASKKSSSRQFFLRKAYN